MNYDIIKGKDKRKMNKNERRKEVEIKRHKRTKNELKTKHQQNE